MDAHEFEAQLRLDGYLEIKSRSMARGVDTRPHRHAFDTRLLVLDGELTVLCDGQARTCRPGDIVEIAAGVEHCERYGSTPVRLIAGLRHPAVVATEPAPVSPRR